MKLTGALFLILISANHGIAQTKLTVYKHQLYSWSEYEACDQGHVADYLNTLEKETIRLISLCRLDGKHFIDSYLKDHLVSQAKKYRSVDTTSSYYTSLIKDLSKIKGLPPLKPDRKLFECAKSHSLDMGRTGRTGHSSSDGTSFYERIKSLTDSGYVGVTECCSYCSNTALEIVCSLLLDEGIPSLGNRKALLDQNLRWVGLSFLNHSTYGVNCTIDLAHEANR